MVFSIYLIFFIILIHFLADFGLQTHKQATMKSTDAKYLIKHVLTYSLTWFFAFFIYLGFVCEYTFVENMTLSIAFFGITYGTHFLTDFVTSKLVKERFDQEDWHNGFVIIGADQALHLIQLFLTVYLLSY